MKIKLLTNVSSFIFFESMGVWVYLSGRNLPLRSVEVEVGRISCALE